MSTSISRGPFGKLGVRPTSRSTDCVARSSAAAVPLHRIAAAAFQKARCAAKPTGSVR
jgi:hypothetical protein